MKRIETLVEAGIFASRWLLLPLYVGMIIAQAFYCYRFGVDLWHLIGMAMSGHVAGEAAAVDAAGHAVTVAAHEAHEHFAGIFLLAMLQLLDMIMVANLVIIVVIGGYATFVSKLDLDGHEDRPAWLDHIDPGTLKTKLAGGLVGVSGIHVLQSFIKLGEPGGPPYESVMWQVIIHAVFTAAVLVMAWSDLLVQRKIMMEHGDAKPGEPKPAG